MKLKCCYEHTNCSNYDIDGNCNTDFLKSIFGNKYNIFQNTEAKRMSLLQKNILHIRNVLRRQTWIFF